MFRFFRFIIIEKVKKKFGRPAQRGIVEECVGKWFLLDNWLNGIYTEISRYQIAGSILALLYFLNPVALIFDVITGDAHDGPVFIIF